MDDWLMLLYLFVGPFVALYFIVRIIKKASQPRNPAMSASWIRWIIGS